MNNQTYLLPEFSIALIFKLVNFKRQLPDECNKNAFDISYHYIYDAFISNQFLLEG